MPLTYTDEDNEMVKTLLNIIDKYTDHYKFYTAANRLTEAIDDLKDECVHCGKGKARYCENCFQDLISQNMKLQLELSDLKNKNSYIPPSPYITTSNPYVKDFPKYQFGIDYGVETDMKPIEIPEWVGTWKPMEIEGVKIDSVASLEEWVKLKQKECEINGTTKENS